MNMAVMYHYVREQEGWNGIVPMTPARFESQVERLCREYDIISVDRIDRPRSSAKPWCVLTFDDGTKDQYDHAFDLLKRKGIPAYFAVMSGPLLTGKVPLVHLVHAVLSFKTDEEIWDKLLSAYDTEGVEEQSSSIYRYESDPLRRYNKYMLNFRLKPEEAVVFCDSLFSTIFSNADAFIRQFYLSMTEIREMHHAGMTIGVHCHHHFPYNGEAPRYFSEEILPCINMLSEQAGFRPVWYTPPFGGGERFKELSRDLTPILQKEGFKGAFSTRRGTVPDLRGFWMDRFDCADLP